MRKNKIENILAGVSPAEKKGILNNLVSTLLSELNEAEKKEIIKTIISGRKESKQLESMVEY